MPTLFHCLLPTTARTRQNILLCKKLPSTMPSTNKGFSLIELMVTTALLATTIGLATPAFADMIGRHQIRQQTDELLASLRLARTQAVSQHLDVYICRATSADQCAESRARWADWSDGWLVFADLNNNREFDADDNIIRQHYDPNRPFLLTINQPGRLRFRHDGSSRNLGFYFCSNRQGHPPINRKLTLLYTGRTRIETLSEIQLPKRCKIHADDA